jgi:hypothetical protein
LSVSSFKDVNWGSDDLLTTDKLNTMVSNTRYLFERTPKLYYNAYNTKKDSGLKIACGTTTIAPGKVNLYRKTVYFGSFFTAGSKPVIVTGVTSPSNRRMITSIYGIQGLGYVPDHRGFVACANTSTTEKSHYLNKQIYFNWVAMGY